MAGGQGGDPDFSLKKIVKGYLYFQPILPLEVTRIFIIHWKALLFIPKFVFSFPHRKEM